jgi:hypothetical protein
MAHTRRSASELFTVLGLVVALLTLVIAAERAGQGLDFALFYDSGQSYRLGGTMYPHSDALLLNLNPPSMTLLLFAPLAAFSRQTAGVIFFTLNLAAFLATLHTLHRSLGLSGAQVARIVAVLACTFPFVSLWFTGTFLWMLMWAMTEAWAAHRAGHHWRAGAWLGLVVATKPYFALTACLVGWRVMVGAGLLSAGLSIATMLVTGIQPWLEWHTTLQSVSWIPYTSNASLWGWLVRVGGAGRATRAGIDALGEVFWVGFFAAVLIVVQSWRGTRHDLDRRWFASVAAAILLSPTGWVFYCVLLLGPFVATWHGQRSLIMLGAVLGFAIPVAMIGWTQTEYWPFITAGSTYFWVLLAAWLVSVTREGAEAREIPV